MDRLQLDKNAKLTGRVYFKDEVMWLGLSGSGASFTFDGTKLVLKATISQWATILLTMQG